MDKWTWHGHSQEGEWYLQGNLVLNELSEINLLNLALIFMNSRHFSFQIKCIFTADEINSLTFVLICLKNGKIAAKLVQRNDKNWIENYCGYAKGWHGRYMPVGLSINSNKRELSNFDHFDTIQSVNLWPARRHLENMLAWRSSTFFQIEKVKFWQTIQIEIYVNCTWVVITKVG